ncbi:MAG: NapC/NirT family cytochrome c [Acidobacteriia bacterium]|nr:NapC/NirT family cytochrome c [Terriglobia bacterium]
MLLRTPRNAPSAGVSPKQTHSENPQARGALARLGRTWQDLELGRFGMQVLRGFAWLPAVTRAQHDVSKYDPVEHYGSRVLAGLIVIGMVSLLYSLIRYRGKTAGPVSWGVLVLGAGILPIVVSSAGGVLVFERSQRVALCSSCHLAMKPYVDDMKDPKSQSLAAIHYANRYIADDQCYSCHTSYGMFGTLQAKAEGIVDVFKYYTHTFSVPLKMRHPYSNNDCLKCHGASAKFLASHTHDRDAMFADEVSCSQCHDDDNPPHNVGMKQ